MNVRPMMPLPGSASGAAVDRRPADLERHLMPREEVSLQRIRQWMDEHAEGAKEVRRQKRGCQKECVSRFL
jgi:hypothetical protein